MSDFGQEEDLRGSGSNNDFSRMEKLVTTIALRLESLDKKIVSVSEEVHSLKMGGPENRTNDSIEHFLSPIGKSAAPEAKKQSISQSDKASTSNRRQSVYKQVVQQESDDREQVLVTQALPAHNIKLTYLALLPVLRFLDEVHEYQAKHAIKLNISTLIGEKVKLLIMSKNYERFQHGNFYSVSTSDLIDMLELAVKPESIAAFETQLRKYAKFTQFDRYEATPMNFKPLYEALLLYRREFMLLYSTMASKNAENVPPCNNKQGGLIEVWLSQIPQPYGQKVYQALLRDNQKFDVFDNFIEQYFKIVHSHYKESVRIATFAFCFSEKPNTDSAFGKSRDMYNRNKSSTTAKPFALNAIEDIQEEESAGGLDNSEFERTDDDFEEELMTQLSYHGVTEEEKEIGEAELYGRKNPIASTDRSLNALTTSKVSFSSNANFQPKSILKAPSKSSACLSMVLTGKCSRSDSECRFSHDKQICKQDHARIAEQLKKSPFGSANVSLNMLELEVETHSLLYNVLVHQHPEVSLLPRVEKTARVFCNRNDRNNILPAMSCLFDTGAQASFVSKEWLDKRRGRLMKNIHPCNARATLADGNTRLLIDECLVVVIDFFDSKSQVHAAEVVFLVADIGSRDFIMGLPDIIQKFGSLFMSMIADEIQRLQDAPTSQQVQLNELSLTPALFQSEDTDTNYPWSMPVETAPEDENTPIPCSANAWLNQIDVAYADKLAAYHAQLESHVDEGFRKETDIITLLKLPEVTSVFVPDDWRGLDGVEPLQLKLQETAPKRMKPATRHVNPRLLDTAKAEYTRLRGYIYRDSNSDIASPLVIAPKATAPFVRFCGDYVALNKHLTVGHYPIPNVKHSLEKLCRFSVFADLDWTNAYHQVPLAPETSKLLSIQTPWGQVEPIFMPEGIGPASGILQKIVSDIFGDFDDFTIAIFDNLLVLAHSYPELFDKLKLVFNRCRERNVILKFSKSWLGFDHANFFGYVCRKDKYELSDERKENIKQIPFPKSAKGMQRFLGSALYFSNFMLNYSTHAAPFNDTIKSDFDWNDKNTWKLDYESLFEEFKTKLTQAIAIHYPDYALEWFLMTDASQVGTGAMLVQKRPATATTTEKLEVIGLHSTKFSPVATRYSTIEQEACAIYLGVYSFRYYLQCKPFVLCTDHNNLVWIEASLVPKIIRWRIFLQSFTFTLKHIPGKDNVVADYLSRLHINNVDVDTEVDVDVDGENVSKEEEKEDEAVTLVTETPSNETPSIAKTSKEILSEIHGGRNGHWGVRQTWNDLNKFVPGHGVSMKETREFIAECPVCQKSRLPHTNTLKPLVRNLRQDNIRGAIGVDLLDMSVPDKKGNRYLCNITNLFSKLAWGFPMPDKTAKSIAKAIFQYYLMFGHFDKVHTDQGSEFMSELFKLLNKWLGTRHCMSTVDVHTSNGQEGNNKQTARHLREFFLDNRFGEDWSDESILLWVYYVMNKTYSSETGMEPYRLHFGDADAIYYSIEDYMTPQDATNAYINRLDTNLKQIREISKQFQDKLAAERKGDQVEANQNKFQPGDYVLMRRDTTKPSPSKLATVYMGPHVVVQQHKNDVQLKSLTQGHIFTAHVDRLKAFFGTDEEAIEAARYDQDQYVIDKFLAYTGEPDKRTTLMFRVLFQDGTDVWLPYSRDLSETQQFEYYCRSQPELYYLLFTAKVADKQIAELNATPIKEVAIGETVYVNIRSFGSDWYQTLDLADKDVNKYVLPMRYVKFTHNGTKAEIRCDLYETTYIFTHHLVKSYGSCKAVGANMIVVTEQMCLNEPSLLPDAVRNKLLRKFRNR
jgi:hypothetical protein